MSDVQPLRKLDIPAERAWAREWVETWMRSQGMEVLSEEVDQALTRVARLPPDDRILAVFLAHLRNARQADGGPS